MKDKIPAHICIIMDGNGRWAKKRGLPRIMGHNQGVKAVRKIVKHCGKIGVKYLTLYTFSTENWQRPEKEVNELMKMLKNLAVKEKEELKKNNVRVKVIGRLNLLPEEVRDNLFTLVKETEDRTGLTLILAISYGGRQEIIDGIKKFIKSGEKDIDEEKFRNFLYAPEIPDPDLLIRTGGEKRISNFLLWQIAYSELYFTDTLWPDFNEKELEKAIEDYRNRERRFGRVKE